LPQVTFVVHRSDTLPRELTVWLCVVLDVHAVAVAASAGIATVPAMPPARQSATIPDMT
jgi:hypothetical protein